MKKLLEALHTIQEECKSHTFCTECPLQGSTEGCKIRAEDPEDWKINDDIPRALL